VCRCSEAGLEQRDSGVVGRLECQGATVKEPAVVIARGMGCASDMRNREVVESDSDQNARLAQECRGRDDSHRHAMEP
jgi:hypothetical protein